MPSFVPGLAPPDGAATPAWVIVRDGAILVDGGEVLVGPPEALGLTPDRRVYLGTFDDRPVLAAVVDAPDDARFVPIRGALAFVGEERFALVSMAAELAHFERTNVFCGRCGARLTELAGERAKACPSCNLHVYPRVHPAVIVLVHDDRRLLLAHRPNAPFFALIAGFVESGESFEECVVREVREEVGVEVTDLRYFGSQTWPFPHQVMVGFFARYAGGEIVVDRKELDEARWFEPDALPPLPPPISIARKLIDAWLAAN